VLFLSHDAQRAALAWLSADGAPPAANEDRPPLVTALREQLGLRLDPTTGAVDVLVVDGAERPVAD
jgi:uncharacterized protein (TIGR03435 family)